MTTENNQKQPTVEELTKTINDLKSQLDQEAATIKELANKYGCDAQFLEELNLPTVTQIENAAIALGAAYKKAGKRVSLIGIAALEKANEDFNKGLITEKQLREIASKVK